MRIDSAPHSAPTVVVVGLDSNLMGVVRETLAAEAVLPTSSIPFTEGLETIQRTLPDVVLVGMTDQTDQAISFARVATGEHPKLTMVAIASHREADEILAAMRVGYKEYLVLPSDNDRLREVVHGAAFTPTAEGEKGHVIAVLGAKGGVGTTVIATHLAAELAAIHRVICIDADFSMGDVAPAMDLIPNDTIAEVLPRADRFDERMLTGATVAHPSKVHFLCQPDDIEQMTDVDPEEMFAVIDVAARAYQYVLLDVGSTIDDVTGLIMSVADQIILVTTPDVVAVRAAHRTIRALQHVGIEKKRISLVLNKVPAKPFLSVEDIEQNLAIPVMATVSEDTRTVSQAVNDGKLVRDINKKAPIALEISQLVSLLSDDPEEFQAPSSSVTRKPGLLTRFFGIGG